MRTTKEIRDDLVRLKKRDQSLKTKKARIKAWDMYHEVNREYRHALIDMVRPYNKNKCVGKVVWFDSKTGEGMIIVPGMEQLGKIEFYACNAVNTCTWYAETACVEFQEWQEVRCTAYTDEYYIHLGARKIVGGIQNITKFNELNKNKDLAFVVLKGQETGLFK